MCVIIDGIERENATFLLCADDLLIFDTRRAKAVVGSVSLVTKESFVGGCRGWAGGGRRRGARRGGGFRKTEVVNEIPTCGLFSIRQYSSPADLQKVLDND